MKKHMVLSTNKHPTKLGKALHGISWMMLMMWIMVGAILLVSEFSFRSILLWLICCAAGVLQLIGIQGLISRYERKQKTPSERASVQQQTGKRETASTFAENVREDWNETQGEAIDEPLRNIARLKEKMIK